MSHDPDVATFLGYCGADADINGLGPRWEEAFADAIRQIRDESARQSFKRGFAKALLGALTAKEYEKVTRWDFDTDAEFRAHLLARWKRFYPNCRAEDFLEQASSRPSSEP